MVEAVEPSRQGTFCSTSSTLTPSWPGGDEVLQDREGQAVEHEVFAVQAELVAVCEWISSFCCDAFKQRFSLRFAVKVNVGRPQQ